MLHPADWSGLSLAVGLSVVESLDPQGALGLGLKWPNDVWVHHPKQWAKLAGILIETAITQQEDRYCVIGVGVNIASPNAQDLSMPAIGLREQLAATEFATTTSPMASSLGATSAPQALALLAKPLLSAVLAFESKGFAPLQAVFQQRDVLRDMPVTLSDGRHGTARGVDNTGVLRVETPQGMQLINSAEVRVRPSIEGV
jgi:BirA family biotin operon repressor/biotin-[acetyl-CoA-carboxylase] ligase